MNAAGFRYIGSDDTACCDTCGLHVSGWTTEMTPFTIHAQNSPTCSFVRSIQPPERIIVPSTTSLTTFTSASNREENPSKRQKTEATQETNHPFILVEVNILKEIRKRTFSFWPHRTSPSSAQLIEAGFFGCNVGDRVICVYCNIICQQWMPHSDDACEIHKILSPKCPYVIAMLKRQQTSSVFIINENTTSDHSLASNSVDPFRSNAIVSTTACHPAFSELPKREASFATWPIENLPSVDSLIRAGFFYTGTKTIVTCFYCNGSLQNWGANDNPTIEHVRWFPNCAYAKQLCGTELYRKIQESKRAQQERTGAIEPNQRQRTTDGTAGRGQLNIPDESTLSRCVAARLDLAISQSLLDRNYKLSIIKRCYEDHLRLQHDDFISDCDLLMACIILQKQIEHIDGKKENIIIPSKAMNKIREEEQAVVAAREQAACTSSVMNSSNNTDAEMSIPLESITNEENTQTATAADEQTKHLQSSAIEGASQGQIDNSAPSNPCVLCLTEEKRLACIPCGHLATCVPCGQALRLCPICRREIEAFVRVYV